MRPIEKWSQYCRAQELLVLLPQQNARRLVSSGVSIAFLLRIWKSLPLLLQPGVNPATLTTADAVRLVILPATARHQCRLTDLISPQHTGQPHFVICHSWQSNFGDLLTQLARHLHIDLNSPLASQEKAQMFVWLDVCAVNQHLSSQRKSLSVSSVKAVVSHSLRGTLLMLDAQQSAMSRMWCMYEVFITLVHRGPEFLEVVIPGREYAAKVQALAGVLEVESCVCSKSSDKSSIHADVLSTSSNRQFNTIIKDALMSKTMVDATILTGDLRAMALFVDSLLGKEAAGIDELVAAGQVMFESLPHMDDYEDVSLMKNCTDSPEEQEKVFMLVMEYLRQFTWVLRHHTEASDLVDVFVRHHARLSDRTCRAFRKQQAYGGVDIPSRKEAAAISEQVRLLLEDEQPMPAAMMMFTWLQNHAEVGDTRAVAGSRGVCVLAAAGLIFLHFHPRMTNTTHTMPASGLFGAELMRGLTKPLMDSTTGSCGTQLIKYMRYFTDMLGRLGLTAQQEWFDSTSKTVAQKERTLNLGRGQSYGEKKIASVQDAIYSNLTYKQLQARPTSQNVVSMQMQISRIIADSRGSSPHSNSGHPGGSVTSRALSPSPSRNFSRSLSPRAPRGLSRSLSTLDATSAAFLGGPTSPTLPLLPPVHSNMYDGARSTRGSSTSAIPMSNLSRGGSDSARVTDVIALQRQIQTVCSSVAVTPRQLESARGSAIWDTGGSSPGSPRAVPSWTERLSNSVTRIMPSIKAKEKPASKTESNLQQGYMRLVNLLKSSTDAAQKIPTLPDVVTRSGMRIPALRLPSS
ncbi:MAG: hypothetical protein WDW36_003861 [Sanguina aurantia]